MCVCVFDLLTEDVCEGKRFTRDGCLSGLDLIGASMYRVPLLPPPLLLLLSWDDYFSCFFLSRDELAVTLLPELMFATERCWQGSGMESAYVLCGGCVVGPCIHSHRM